MKFLIPCWLFVSSMAFGQSYQYDLSANLHWVHAKTITLTYSPALAPPEVSHATAIQVLNEVANRLNGLGLPGLNIVVGNLNLPNACEHRAAWAVHVCWGPRGTRRADTFNYPMTDGGNFWREGVLLMGNEVSWSDPTRPFKQQVYHYLLHVLGFAHPPRDTGEASVINNIGDDLSALDIEGLRGMFTTGRCAVTYDEYGTVYVPFVSYGGRAYSARLQHQGGGQFAIVPGTLAQYGWQHMPTTPCQGLAFSGNELHFPEVWVNGQLLSATLVFENGRFSLKR